MWREDPVPTTTGFLGTEMYISKTRVSQFHDLGLKQPQTVRKKVWSQPRSDQLWLVFRDESLLEPFSSPIRSKTAPPNHDFPSKTERASLRELNFKSSWSRERQGARISFLLGTSGSKTPCGVWRHPSQAPSYSEHPIAGCNRI